MTSPRLMLVGSLMALGLAGAVSADAEPEAKPKAEPKVEPEGKTIGPFSFTGTDAQEEVVRRALEAIDPKVPALDTPGRITLVFGRPPGRVPGSPGVTPWGYAQRARPGRKARITIDDSLGAAKQLYVVIHEYAHQWFGRNGTRAMRQALAADMNPPASLEEWSKGKEEDRPAEAACEAAVSGWTHGKVASPLRRWFRRKYAGGDDKFLETTLRLARTAGGDAENQEKGNAKGHEKENEEEQNASGLH